VSNFTPQADMTRFLQTTVSTLITIDKPTRIKVYKLLVELKESRASSDPGGLRVFLKDIDLAICKLLVGVKDKDFSVIRRSIAILAEASAEGVYRFRLCTPWSL
jgi:hypothetical protein